MVYRADAAAVKFNLKIMAFSSYVSGFSHQWGEDKGPETACRLCGKHVNETIGGCLVAAAVHREQAPETMRKTLEFVRPNHRAEDLYHLPFDQYMAARWNRNAEAIERLGLGLNRDYCVQTRLKWAEEYWSEKAINLQKVLTDFHDIFSEIVEDGRALFVNGEERNKALKVFARSNRFLQGNTLTTRL